MQTQHKGYLEMKMLKTTIVSAMFMAVGVSAASAQDLYAGGTLGFTGGGGEDVDFGVDLVFESGLAVSSFIGKDLGNARVEGEIAYRHNDMSTWAGLPVVGEMSSLAFMGNAYYDFGTGSGITPYIGIGMGFASVTMNSVDYSTNDTDMTLALQIMAGLSFPVADNMSMVVDLRSFGAAPTFVDSGSVSYLHGYGVGSLSVGVMTKF